MHRKGDKKTPIEKRVPMKKKQIANGKVIKVTNVTKGFDFEVNADLSDRQKEMLYAGGLLNYTKQNS